MKRNSSYYFSIFTILLFTLGLFNMIFAWLGFICLVTPFILLVKKKKNIWCQSYCPRANLFTILFKKTKHRPTPRWLKQEWTKKLFLYYFLFNLIILIWSTFLVSQNFMESMEMIRFMIVFRLPWNVPQIINIPNLPAWTIHLSFRIYSMMFTTTIIGLILGLLYKPRTWCTICPVMTLSNRFLSKNKQKASEF